MTDLTALTTPLGLLRHETRAALKAHGGPYQRFDGVCWVDCGLNDQWPDYTYRVKPQPPKPREWWLYGQEAGALHVSRVKPEGGWAHIIHVREVLP